jgi:hypothetical protein
VQLASHCRLFADTGCSRLDRSLAVGLPRMLALCNANSTKLNSITSLCRMDLDKVNLLSVSQSSAGHGKDNTIASCRPDDRGAQSIAQ